MSESNQEKRTPMYPRDGAGSFTIPSTKGEHIKTMVTLREFVEIYSPTETFKMQTPEAIDPGRTNPNAMFVIVKTADVGSASPFVSRTIIMADEMLKGGLGFDKARRDTLMEHLHKIKEGLVQCGHAAESFRNSVSSQVEEFKASGGRLNLGGRSLAKFPLVSDIDAKVTAFLIPARRVLTDVCHIPAHFLQVKRPHSNMEHLLEKELIPQLGENHELVKWLGEGIQITKRVVDLRNAQEHATTGARPLQVKNFHALPSNDIRAPVWLIEGEAPMDIGSEMEQIASEFLNLAEGMLAGCIGAHLPTFPPMILYVDPDPDPQCPVRYKLTIDGRRFSFPNVQD